MAPRSFPGGAFVERESEFILRFLCTGSPGRRRGDRNRWRRLGVDPPVGRKPERWFVYMVGWGILAMALTWLWFSFVARSVYKLNDGSYSLGSRRRQLTVTPDQITSMRGFGWFFDFFGAYPFLMRTARGSLLIDRHMRGGTELEQTLRLANAATRIQHAWDLGPTRTGRPEPGLRTLDSSD
jgi:hypothetical protein